MTVHKTLQKAFYWLLFMLCFVGLPGLLVVYGFVYSNEQNRQNQLQKHGQALRSFYQNLQQFANNEAFYCNFLNSRFSNAAITSKNKRETIAKRLAEFRQQLSFDYILYHQKTGIATSSFTLENTKEWELAMEAIAIYSQDSSAKISEEGYLAIGRLMGPQFNFEHLDRSRNPEEPHLVYPDSIFEKPMLWAGRVHEYLIIIFVKASDLESSNGVWNTANEFSSSTNGIYRFSIAEKGGFRHPDILPELRNQVEEALRQHEQGKQSQIQTRDLIVFPRFLTHKLTVLGYIEKASLRTDHLILPSILAAIFFLIAMIMTGRYSYGLIVSEMPDNLSLRWKLRFLFFFANGLPLIVLFFIGSDFLDQKRDNLLREMHDKGTKFVQDFDEKIEIEYAKALTSKKIAEKDLIDKLSTQSLNDEVIKSFAGKLSKNADWKVVLVASRSHLIGTEVGIIDDKKGILPDSYKNSSDQGLSQREYTRKVGQFFLDKINGTKVSDKAATEIELLLESVTQKPLVNFIFEMLRNRGTFIEWGFGRNKSPSILDTMHLKGSKTADYFFVANIRRMTFQYDFLTTYIPQANRNQLGLKILAINDIRFTVPKEAFVDTEVRDFAGTLTTYPADEIRFMTYEDQQYLAMGFEGKYIKEYKLIGLYPLEKIDAIIRTQRRQLIVFAILSLLMTLALSQVLSQSFLVPLHLLTAGAHAIENKNFKHRLPDLGRDEFGSMGSIFNDVMIDLEELSVAGAIQEQLLPQQQIETGRFSLYGRSIAMGELGGDYFDHIQINDEKFSVLLGDVAGHGVGAALIMAMAKAGIIQSEDLLDQPLALLNRLHGLIYASKTKKQKKIMTFQYLCVDSQTGRAIYANAGACSPMIIRKNQNRVEELTLTGAALGAFKKPNYSEIEIVFEPGDAIVFYTDGIVEARNSSGEEINYDNLKTLLKNSWNEDAEVFYNNIYQAYMNHLAGEGAQDDLTMVILVYTGKDNRNRVSTDETA